MTQVRDESSEDCSRCTRQVDGCAFCDEADCDKGVPPEHTDRQYCSSSSLSIVIYRKVRKAEVGSISVSLR